MSITVSKSEPHNHLGTNCNGCRKQVGRENLVVITAGDHGYSTSLALCGKCMDELTKQYEEVRSGE